MRKKNRKAHTLTNSQTLESEKLIQAILETPREHRPALTPGELDLLKAHSAKILEDTPPHGVDFLAAGQS
jgi:hypothetical protein